MGTNETNDSRSQTCANELLVLAGLLEKPRIIHSDTGWVLSNFSARAVDKARRILVEMAGIETDVYNMPCDLDAAPKVLARCYEIAKE